MFIDKDKLPRWFKSNPLPLSFAAEQIDETEGILKDVVMCETGPAKGHGVHLEQEFIDGLIAYDNKHFAETGIKARFGHPSMSDTTMGTQMGVFRNFRVRDNQAIADLHLLDSADLSPTNPGMKAWMLSMAQERPDFVMSSIVFRGSGHYQRTEKNEKYKIFYYKVIKGEDGEEARKWVGANQQYGEIFVEFDAESETAQHFYTDLVEAGAATENLFSNQFNQDKFGVQASEFVREHPALLKFLQENPAKLVEFAKGLGVELPKEKTKLSDKLKEMVFGKEDTAPVETFDDLKSEFSAQITALKDAATTKQKAHATELAAAVARAETAETALAAAQAQLEEWGELIPEPPTELKPGTQEPPLAPQEETAFVKKLRQKAQRYTVKK